MSIILTHIILRWERNLESFRNYLKAPIVSLQVGLISGIIFKEVIVLSFFIFVFGILLKFNKSTFYFLAIGLALSILTVFGHKAEAMQEFLENEKGEILEVDSSKDYRQVIVLNIQDKKVISETNKYPTYSEGQILKTSGKLIPIEEKYDFESYVTYLKSKEIGHFYELREIDVVSKNAYRSLFYSLRKDIENFYFKNLNSENSALLAGIVLGTKASFDEEFKELLSVSGTSHIVAASGFNVAIIYLAILAVFKFIDRKWLFLLSGILIFFYISLIGTYNIPAFRAMMMIYLLLSSKIVGIRLGINMALLYSTSIMMISNPNIWTNVSFQLSVGALLGLTLFTNHFKYLIEKIKFKNIKLPVFLSEILSTSLAVMVFTIPVLWHYFHGISLIGVVANLAILPLIPLITLMGIISLIFMLINFSILERLIFVTLDFLLEIQINAIRFFGGIDILFIESFSLVVLAYLGIIALIFYADINLVKNEKNYNSYSNHSFSS